MKIAIASDHAGFKLKEVLIPFLAELGHEVKDCGPKKYDPEDDYPIYIREVGEEVSKHPEKVKGIVIGSSGQGEAIVANKFKGVRAALYYGIGSEIAKATDKQEGKDSKSHDLSNLYAMKIIELSRLHNDANVLSLGAKFMNDDEAKAAVKLWLETPFSKEERHVRRIEEITKIESNA